MENKKNVTLFCSSFRFSSIEFNKPPFLIMKNIKKIYNYETSIVFDDVLKKVFYKDDKLISMDEYQGVNLINLTKNKKISSKKTIELYKTYLLEHAKDIDLLIVFHGNLTEIKLCNYYKKLNPNGKVMIILDFSVEEYVKQQAKLKIKLKNILKSSVFKNVYNKFYNNCDIFSVQTKTSLEFLSKNKWNGLDIKNKLEYLPFGFDRENLLIDNKNQFEYNKENLIITVGRIGTYQKNNELILDALQQIDLKDYKFYFIGPIEQDFNAKIEEFYKNNPTKIESVKFLGAINDRKELSDYYKKSKLFILSSRSESFGLVLTEALCFGNYFLSTDVGCAKDLAIEGVGELFENSNELALKIEQFINSEKITDKNKIYELISNYDYEQIVYKSKILNRLEDKK